MKFPLKIVKHAAGVLLLFLKNHGVEPKCFWRAVRNTGRFIRNYRAFRTRLADSSPEAKRSLAPRAHLLFSCLRDFDDSAGALGVYFHQDLWAARKIYSRRPAEHVDMGSRIDGFIAHLLVFMKVSVADDHPGRLRWLEAGVVLGRYPARDTLAEDVSPDDYLESGYKVGLFEFTKRAASP